jgi:hypothetical protein
MEPRPKDQSVRAYTLIKIRSHNKASYAPHSAIAAKHGVTEAAHKYHFYKARGRAAAQAVADLAGATKARSKHLDEHPSRAMRGGLYKADQRRYRQELQLRELLVVANDPKAASAASMLTLRRLDNYLHNMAATLRPLELFSRWHTTD